MLAQSRNGFPVPSTSENFRSSMLCIMRHARGGEGKAKVNIVLQRHSEGFLGLSPKKFPTQKTPHVQNFDLTLGQISKPTQNFIVT